VPIRRCRYTAWFERKTSRWPGRCSGRGWPITSSCHATPAVCRTLSRGDLGRPSPSCRLADLALAEPLPLFRDGSRLILEALRAARGCAFAWSEQDNRLDLAVTVGGDEGLGAGDPEPVRSAASRCMRTGERLWLPPGTAGAPPGGLTCVPVRDQESTVGVICLSATTAEGSPAPEDWRVADGLAGILARLYRAAVRRQEYARLAHRAKR